RAGVGAPPRGSSRGVPRGERGAPPAAGGLPRRHHDDGDGLELARDLGDPTQLRGPVPADRLDRGGEQPVGVTAGQPDPHGPDVDADPDAAPEARFRVRHRATTPRTSATMPSSAAGTAPGSVPPPWATSSLPPPPPPRRPAAERAS